VAFGGNKTAFGKVKMAFGKIETIEQKTKLAQYLFVSNKNLYFCSTLLYQIKQK
jgi:hypothetical protein